METREKIESDLKESEFKQRSLAKAYNIIHAQANSFLIFTVQWKDLEDHFESTRNSLDTRFGELEAREEDIGVRETKLEAKEWNFRSEMEAKASELHDVDRLIDQKLKEVTECNNHLHSLSSLIQEHSDEVIVQEKRLMEVEKFVREKEMKFDSVDRRVKERTKKLNWVQKIVEQKETEFDWIDQRVKEGTKNLNWVEKILEDKSKLAESKEDEVKRFQEALNKYVEDIELKKRQLNEILGSIEKHKKEFDLKEELIEATKRSIEECDKELILKEEKFKLIQKSLVECSNTLESREKMIREIDLKERDFGLLKKSMEEWSCKLDFKARELELIENRVSERLNEVKLKEKNLNELQKSMRDGEKHLDKMSKGLQMKESQLEDQIKELALRQKEVESIKKSTEEHTQNLKSKERQLEDQSKELELKQKEFFLIKKSTEEHTLTVKLKESQLEDKAKELALKQKEFILIKESTEEHNRILKAKERQLEDQAKELELKQKEFDLSRKSSEELIQNLKSKERQLEDQANGIELKQKEIDSIKKSTEEHTRNLKGKEKTNALHSQVKIEQLEYIPSNQTFVPSSSINQSSIYRDGRGLQLFMNEHLKRIDAVGNEISTVLEASLDPAKLVLDAMQGFYPSNSTVDNRGCNFDLRVIRRSCILLLEALKKVSPQINPPVREEAIKLAGDWKAKMTGATENWLEILGFLRLVTTYEINSAYDGKELQSLIATIAENEQATELSQALGSTEKASASIICSPVKTEKPESSLTKNAAAVSSPNPQLTATTDARNLQGFVHELARGKHLIQNETLAALLTSLDPAKFVLDVMQNSFVEYWGNGDVRSRESVMLSYINLLEQLICVSPHVGSHVKDDARKLAILWKTKIGTDTQNSLEHLGFLQFIATYGLFSTVTRYDMVSLLGRISKDKQTRELCQKLSFADKIPAHFIQNLIEGRQLIEAVRLICTFKLIDTFPPVPLLEKFVENTKNWNRRICKKKKSPDEKVKVLDNEITDLRAVIQCIKDCNLESVYPSGKIELLIAVVEKIKEDERRSATSLTCKVGQQEENKSLVCEVEQHEQSKFIAIRTEQQEANKFEQQKQTNWNKRRGAQPNQQQHPNKFQRTLGSAARPYRMPTSSPDYQHRSLPSWQHENFRHPGQFGMAAANEYGVGANCGHPMQFGRYANDYEIGAMRNSGSLGPYHP